MQSCKVKEDLAEDRNVSGCGCSKDKEERQMVEAEADRIQAMHGSAKNKEMCLKEFH